VRRTTQSVPRWNVCGDGTLFGSDKVDSGLPNTTDSRCSLGMGAFLEHHQALIDNISLDGISLQELHKSLTTVGIYQQVARQLKDRI